MLYFKEYSDYYFHKHFIFQLNITIISITILRSINLIM